MKQFKMLVLSSMLILFTACGGGSSSDDGKQPVNPVADTTAPIITIIGNNPETIIQNTAYIDPGAIAVDDRDGTISISTTGNVDTSTVGVYTLHYSAVDSASNTATKTRTVFVNEFFQANIYIIAEAGINQNIHTASTVTLDASTSTSVEGNLLSYKWTIVSKPGDKAVLSNESIVNPTFVADVEGTYLIQLTVKDALGNSSSDTVVITATTGNAAPVAHAGPNQNISTTSIVTLDGSASSDTDHNELTYQWNFENKPNGSNAILSSETDVHPTFVADVDGSYVIQLIVNDGTMDSISVTTTITANTVNSAPVAKSITYRDRVTSYYTGDHIYLVADASDADDDTLTYYWSFLSRPTESTASRIFNSNGLTANGDFFPDAPGTYVLQVKAYDDHVYSNQVQITIHINNIPRWGTAALVETTRGDARFPQIAMDAHGNAMTLWQQDDGSSINIVSRRYLPASGWGAKEVIDSSSENASVPQIAMSPNGNAISVWVQDNDIVANIYRVNEGWGYVKIIDEHDSWANSPQISINTNGNAVAVWNQSPDSDEDWVSAIQGNYYTTTFGWGTPESLDCDCRNVWSSNPQTAIGSDGDALVVWSENADGTSHAVVGISYTNRTWENSPLLPGGGGYNPQIDMNDNAILTWYQQDRDGDNVYAGHYVSGVWRNTANIGNGYASQISMNENGDAVIIWRNAQNILASHYTPNSSWSIAEIIGGVGHYRQISVSNNGDAIAVWISNDGKDLLANRYVAGIGWGTANVIDNGNGEVNTPQIAMNDNGDAMVVWYQYDGSYFSIYSNRFE